MDEKQKNKEYGFGRFSEYRNMIGYTVLSAPIAFLSKITWRPKIR